ncbi:MAG TPA: hypothetical protein VIV84_10250, partial [Burkholderiaceae bacterium]
PAVPRAGAGDDLIALVGAVDGILQGQSAADADYFTAITSTVFTDAQREQISATVLKAYRWQYIVSGVMEPRFQKLLHEMVTAAQMQRIQGALAPLMHAMPAAPANQPASEAMSAEGAMQ